MRVIRIEVTGRVQGVGFRWFVLERARILNLSGWVRNLAHGTVEVAAAGEPDAVENLLSAVHHGPPGASVRSVRDLEPPAASELVTPFTIR